MFERRVGPRRVDDEVDQAGRRQRAEAGAQAVGVGRRFGRPPLPGGRAGGHTFMMPNMLACARALVVASCARAHPAPAR
jgi:hypothetical protein